VIAIAGRDVPLPPLYAILDADAAARAGWTLADLAAAYLDGGARFLQIRAKEASSAWLLETAEAIVARAHEAGAVVASVRRPRRPTPPRPRSSRSAASRSRPPPT
jgi:hypothetical protein